MTDVDCMKDWICTIFQSLKQLLPLLTINVSRLPHAHFAFKLFKVEVLTFGDHFLISKAASGGHHAVLAQA